jgi:hypothetical protein
VRIALRSSSGATSTVLSSRATVSAVSGEETLRRYGAATPSALPLSVMPPEAAWNTARMGRSSHTRYCPSVALTAARTFSAQRS